MPSFEPNLWMLICGWIFASVLIGLGSGFMIGRWFTLAREPESIRKDRDRTLTALMTLLASTDKLNENVGEHSTALAVAQEDISQLKGNDEVEVLQGKLLHSIESMVESNRKLEDELVVSRYQLEQQTQQLDATKREARTDALCELGNRKAFDEAMSFMATRLKSHGTQYALMLIDIDYFKRINDTFGHAAGDLVLMSIGQSLVDCVRPDDQVFRIGGDEFGILLKGVSEENVTAVGKRIREDVELCDFHVEEESTVVTMSMGLTIAQPRDTPETLFVRADEALYQSKEQGRNRLTTKIGSQSVEFAGPEKEETPPTSAFGLSSYEQFKVEVTNAES